MRQGRWVSWLVAVTLAVGLGGMRPAAAIMTSDEAAAILIWPDIFVSEIRNGFRNDRVIQITNTSADPVAVKCFYENANGHCDNTGAICEADDPDGACFDNDLLGNCIPGWNEVDFRVVLTPYQPLGWLARDGMAGFAFQQPGFGLPPPPPLAYGFFPIDGFFFAGIGGATNVGSQIPPVPEIPFDGMLKCIAVDAADNPVDRNVLKGEHTQIETFFADIRSCPASSDDGGAGCFESRQVISVAKSTAIGIKAIPDRVNGDNVLCLGGEPNEFCPDGPEYEGCPNFLILDHFFSDAKNPVFPPSIDSDYETDLVLVPCTQDLLRQIPGSAVVQYLVYNEFEQRFSTSRSMVCKQDTELDDIDTTQDERSIWDAGVAGTLTGQTRMHSIGSGLVGVASEDDADVANEPEAEFHLYGQGDRLDPDVIILP